MATSEPRPAAPPTTARERVDARRGDGGKPSAIVTRAELRKQRGGIERMTAWIVLLVSFIGSIAALTPGGWVAILAHRYSFAAIGGGFIVQLVLTVLEWYYKDQPLIAWSARSVDAYLTALGYGPLIITALTAALAPRVGDRAGLAAWAIIGVVCLLIAWFPEDRLVD